MVVAKQRNAIDNCQAASVSRATFSGGWILFLLLLAACAGDGPLAEGQPPNGPSTDFATLQNEILDQNCTSGPCHNPQAAAAGLILVDGFSFTALVDADPTNPSAASAGLRLVDPFDTENSFLLAKVEDPAAGQGSRMPLGADPLSDEQIQLIRDWISNGAPGPMETPEPTPTVVPTS